MKTKAIKWYDLIRLRWIKSFIKYDDLFIRIFNDYDVKNDVLRPHALTEPSSYLHAFRVTTNDINVEFDIPKNIKLTDMDIRHYYDFNRMFKSVSNRNIRHILVCLYEYPDDFMDILGKHIVSQDITIKEYSLWWGKTYINVEFKGEMLSLNINNCTPDTGGDYTYM